MRIAPRKFLACLLACALIFFNGAPPILAAAAQNKPTPAFPAEISPFQLMERVRDIAVAAITAPREIGASGLTAPAAQAQPGAQPLTIEPGDHALLSAFIARAERLAPRVGGPLIVPDSAQQPGIQQAQSGASSALANLTQVGPVAVAPFPGNSLRDALSGHASNIVQSASWEVLNGIIQTLRRHPDIATINDDGVYTVAQEIWSETTAFSPPESAAARSDIASPGEPPKLVLADNVLPPESSGVASALIMPSPQDAPPAFKAEDNLAGEKGALTLNRLFNYAHDWVLTHPSEKETEKSFFERALDVVLVIQRLDRAPFFDWLRGRPEQNELLSKMKSLNLFMEGPLVEHGVNPLLFPPSFADVEIWQDRLDTFPGFGPKLAGRLLSRSVQRSIEKLGKDDKGQVYGISSPGISLREIGAFSLHNRIIILKSFAEKATPNQLVATILALRLGMASYSDKEIKNMVARVTEKVFFQPIKLRDLKIIAARATDSAKPARGALEDIVVSEQKESIRSDRPSGVPTPPPTRLQRLGAKLKNIGSSLRQAPNGLALLFSWAFLNPLKLLRDPLATLLRVAAPAAALGAALGVYFAGHDTAAFALSLVAILSHLIGRTIPHSGRIASVPIAAASGVSIPVKVHRSDSRENEIFKIIRAWDLSTAVAQELETDGNGRVFLRIKSQSGEFVLGIDDQNRILLSFKIGDDYYPFTIVPDEQYSGPDAHEMAFSTFAEFYWPGLKQILRSHIPSSQEEEARSLFNRLRGAIKEMVEGTVAQDSKLSWEEIYGIVRNWDIRSAKVSAFDKVDGLNLSFSTKDGDVTISVMQGSIAVTFVPGQKLSYHYFNIVSDTKYAEADPEFYGLWPEKSLMSVSAFKKLYWPPLEQEIQGYLERSKSDKKKADVRKFNEKFTRALENLDGDSGSPS